MDRPNLNDFRESEADKTEITRFVKLWFSIAPPDAVLEVRALNVPNSRTVSGYFDATRPGNCVEAIAELSGLADGVYVTINPVNSALLARAANRVVRHAKHATGDRDVIRRILILIDFDPKRPSGISSTDAELTAAVAAATACRAWLRSLGWPDPIFGESGNGAHLLYRIDLPNDADATALVKRVLKAIAAHCDSEAVTVDQSVSNAGRISKIFGTMARKGDSTDDRPHRIAKLIEVPVTVETVSREQLESLAASVGNPASLSSASATANGEMPYGLPVDAFDIEAWIERCKVHVVKTKPWKEGGTLYELARCPFRPNETDGHPFIIRHADGGISAGCHHNKCKAGGKNWSDFRDVFEPGWRQLPTIIADGSQPETDLRNQPKEGIADPHRLARICLKTAFHHPDGVTVRSWLEKWWHWDGCAWRPILRDELRKEVQDCVKAEFDQISIRTKRTARQVTAALKSNVVDVLNGLALVPSRVQQPAWLDGKGPWPADEVLPARNGLIHIPSLATGKDYLRAPTPNFFSHSALDFDFDADAPTPKRWLRFLSEIWPDDSQSIETLQEWFAYLLTPDNRQQKLLMLVGRPRSGKGTILRVITKLVGVDNTVGNDIATLAGGFGMMPLLGKSVAFISDARVGKTTNTTVVLGRVLSIVGQDAMTVDVKHKTQVCDTLSVRFVMAMNELPQFDDVGGAFASRAIVLNFDEDFRGREDRDLQADLNAELPGILLWAMPGWRRLRERGRFVQPESSKPVFDDLDELGSRTREFAQECLEEGEGFKVLRSDCYARYCKWCEENGEKPVTAALLGRNLRAVIKRLGKWHETLPDGSRPRWYTGIRLRHPASPSLGNV